MHSYRSRGEWMPELVGAFAALAAGLDIHAKQATKWSLFMVAGCSQRMAG